MVLKSDYGKKLIELSEEEFIYKSGLRKVVIKRDNIRSIFHDNEILGILTYDGKIYSLSLGSLLFSERSKLEELRQELNKEKILFNYTNTNNGAYLMPIWFINIINITPSNYKYIMGIILIIILILLLRYGRLLNTKVLFNIDKEQFEIIRRNKTIKYNKYEVDKLKFKKYNNQMYSIEFSKNKNKYNILFKDNPYLIKIYDVSLQKLFSQNREDLN